MTLRNVVETANGTIPPNPASQHQYLASAEFRASEFLTYLPEPSRVRISRKYVRYTPLSDYKQTRPPNLNTITTTTATTTTATPNNQRNQTNFVRNQTNFVTNFSNRSIRPTTILIPTIVLFYPSNTVTIPTNHTKANAMAATAAEKKAGAKKAGSTSTTSKVTKASATRASTREASKNALEAIKKMSQRGNTNNADDTEVDGSGRKRPTNLGGLSLEEAMKLLDGLKDEERLFYITGFVKGCNQPSHTKYNIEPPPYEHTIETVDAYKLGNALYDRKDDYIKETNKHQCFPRADDMDGLPLELDTIICIERLGVGKAKVIDPAKKTAATRKKSDPQDRPSAADRKAAAKVEILKEQAEYLEKRRTTLPLLRQLVKEKRFSEVTDEQTKFNRPLLQIKEEFANKLAAKEKVCFPVRTHPLF